MLRFAFIALLLLGVWPSLSADDGYRLWLRYERQAEVAALSSIVLATPDAAESPTLVAAREELSAALASLTGRVLDISLAARGEPVAGGAREGFAITTTTGGAVRIAANSDVGALYGVFALLRQLQTGGTLAFTSAPKIERRLLNHWDNLDRFVERGYAGFSLWEWFYL